MVPMAGMTVVVTSTDANQYVTTVGSDGEWKVADLPPGTYDVDLLHDDSMYVQGRRWHVAIASRACIRDDIRVESNGGLTGELSHFEAGADWSFLTVFALPAGKTKLSDEALEDHVDFKHPSFDLSPLPAGKYILGAYVTKTVRSKDGDMQRQLAPTFYPGVTDLKAATVLDVPDGKMLRDLYFTVMPTDFLPDNWGCLTCSGR
jgi:hypothetical protein